MVIKSGNNCQNINMFDESAFFDQLGPFSVQLELKKLRQLKLIDQIAFLELTALSMDRFNPAAAYSSLCAYLSAAYRCKLSENKVNRYFALQDRIYGDLNRNFHAVLIAWNDRNIELDPENHPPIVVADNLTQYLIREPEEVDAALRKVSILISN